MYARNSAFDNEMQARQKNGIPLSMNEDEDEEETQDTKRIKLDPGASASSAQAWSSSHIPGIKTETGGDWYLNYDSAVALIPAEKAANDLARFFDSVSASAVDQQGMGAAQVTKVLYTLDGVTLRLRCANPIDWSWVISFAMGMVDSMKAGNPLQFAASIISVKHQSIIQADLILGGRSLV